MGLNLVMYVLYFHFPVQCVPESHDGDGGLTYSSTRNIFEHHARIITL